MKIAVHGGAGTISKELLTKELEIQYHEALAQALNAGWAILEKGASAIQAVETAVSLLEDFPLFNAGKGSVFTNNGLHEMDASIMDGKFLKAGAVAGVRKIKNPIKLAKEVMDNSEHVLLIADGAEEFALQHAIEFADADFFYTDARYEQLINAKKNNQILLDHIDDKKFGTVGAVALDQFGNLAAGTSTGGMTNKMFGRVGDTPIIGSGVYANNKTCAISCTGHGEFFMRYVVAYDISCLMEYKNYSLEKACSFVVLEKLKNVGGEGGVIAIDQSGNICMPFNTPGMYRGKKENERLLFTSIF